MNAHSRGSKTCLVYKEDVEGEYLEPLEKKKSSIIIKDLKVKEEKKVHWSEDTVNNENMGLKKSKSKYKTSY